MRDIRASAEVTGLIGPEALRELEGVAYERYSCWRCGGPGRTTDPTTVVVLAYKPALVMEFAHAECVASQVVELDADGPADMEAFGAGDMNSKAAVLEYPAGLRFRAVLVLEPAVEMTAIEPGGDRASLWLSRIIE